jgi:hypothetical protein
MKAQILEIAERLQNKEITTDNAEALLLSLFSVTRGFSKKELRHILDKVKRARVKNNVKQILQRTYKASYESEEDLEFLDRYTGKEVNVYEWAGDWWICEDDNYCMTEECFEFDGVDNY